MVLRCADGIEQYEKGERIDLSAAECSVDRGTDEEKEKGINREQIAQTDIFCISKDKKTDEHKRGTNEEADFELLRAPHKGPQSPGSQNKSRQGGFDGYCQRKI